MSLNKFGPCIYCREPANGNEHWLPRAIGNFKGFTYLVNVLCSDCNVRLGKLDEEFVRVGPEGVLREFAGVTGRHEGPSINPVYYKAASSNPTRMEVQASGHPEHELRMEPWRDDDGNPRGRPARQLGFKTSADNIKYIPLNLEWPEAVLRAALESHGVAGAELVEVYVDKDEVEKARALLSPVFPGFRAELFSRDGEPEKRQIKTAHTLGPDYFRALTKIGFHSALKLVPALNGAAPQFDPIRAFISTGRALR